jgi:hypothetical protein
MNRRTLLSKHERADPRRREVDKECPSEIILRTTPTALARHKTASERFFQKLDEPLHGPGQCLTLPVNDRQRPEIPAFQWNDRQGLIGSLPTD